ncbi:MAG TPA: hypothetical protein VIY68_16590 [Steroidobacteraceae bacterium]
MNVNYDSVLLKALAKGHRWQRKIENGDYASITELAKAEDVNQSYACRILRLTLLAPSIVVKILNDRQNSDLMLKRLMKPLPVRWDEQLAAIEMEDAAFRASRSAKITPREAIAPQHRRRDARGASAAHSRRMRRPRRVSF